MAKHFYVVLECLCEIGFLEPNPISMCYCQCSGHLSWRNRMVHTFKFSGRSGLTGDRTLGMDKTELTNNQAGLRSGRK